MRTLNALLLALVLSGCARETQVLLPQPVQFQARANASMRLPDAPDSAPMEAESVWRPLRNEGVKRLPPVQPEQREEQSGPGCTPLPFEPEWHFEVQLASAGEQEEPRRLGPEVDSALPIWMADLTE